MPNAAPTSADTVITPQEGVNFTQTYTAYDATAATSATNNPDYPAPPFRPGTHMMGSDNTEYVFVKATTALEQYVCAAIDKDGNSIPLTLAGLQAGTEYGWPQVAIAAGAYGWVAIRGLGIGVLARLSSLASQPCYISGISAGRITTTSVRTTSGGRLTNVVLTTSVTSTPSGATVANAAWPGWIRAT
jgi:hypothetical protein